jgi:hypothetical protein
VDGVHRGAAFGDSLGTIMDGIHANIQELVASERYREVRNLSVMGMDPSQPADQLAVIKQLEISARAEQRSRKMALDYALSRTKS